MEAKRGTSQAERILAKFGGARRLAELFFVVGSSRDPSGIYRWAYPKSKGGTGGLIPTNAWSWIRKAAELDGIEITDEDLKPIGLESGT
jgi:hypothetical protein